MLEHSNDFAWPFLTLYDVLKLYHPDMESLIVKQENKTDEPMEMGSDFQAGNQELSEFDNLEALPMDINDIKSQGDSILANETNSVEQLSNKRTLGTLMPVSAASTQTSQLRMVSLTNNSRGTDNLVLQNNRIVLSSAVLLTLRTIRCLCLCTIL